MERETSLNTIEFEQQQIKQVITNNFNNVIEYLVKYDPCFPTVCGHASDLFSDIIKEKTGINMQYCKGTREDKLINDFCDFHYWLEYGNLIIDPTDFQFYAYDYSSLPPISNCPDNKELDLSEKYGRGSYFLYLSELARKNQININFFANELKRCFNCKIFYSKSDQNYIYQPI